MNKDTVLDKGYVIATILNVFFLLGLIFISHFENLYILILYEWFFEEVFIYFTNYSWYFFIVFYL
ncbi:hypothetical protein [Staphylococcus aureus]|uniref:hypothetical protein n=1 Tax=Staphylococcus aureus TaxID=1280 RepID=UPI000BA772D5|nr:hypothetical protein [Staphylococcus aureus]